MPTDYDQTVNSMFHQLYDHSLGWGLYADDAKAIAHERWSDEEWMPWGITEATLIVAAAEKLLAEQVVVARTDGASWRAIGACMGVHASAAHRWAARRNLDEQVAKRREEARNRLYERHES